MHKAFFIDFNRGGWLLFKLTAFMSAHMTIMKPCVASVGCIHWSFTSH